jgi:hypothetical protein
MDLWGKALALVTEAEDDINKSDAAQTPDQKLAVAQIYATLSVAQELTTDETTTPRAVMVRGAVDGRARPVSMPPPPGWPWPPAVDLTRLG